MRYQPALAVLSAKIVALAALFAVNGLSAGSALADGLPVAQVKHDGPVDFEKEILPILRRNCLACHNRTDAESDLALETPQQILKGGAQGPAVVPGKSDESLLFMVSAHREESFMPPPDNDRGAKNLTPEELGLLKLWIDEGAKGEVTGLSGPVNWQPLPPGVNPIYAVAVAPHGDYVAAGRANQIFLYHTGTKSLLGKLTDPALLEQGVYDKPGVAHLDLVQSLAFSPDGKWLASGGYRAVKLWGRPENPRKGELPGIDAVVSLATSSDGRLAAVGEAGGKIKLFDLSEGKLAHTLEAHAGPVHGVCFSADGGLLVSGSADKTFALWQTADGKELGRVETPVEVNAVALVLEEKQVATGGSDHVIRTWALPGSEPPAEAKPEEGEEGEEGPAGPQPIKEIAGHGGPITALVAVGEGAQLLSGSLDGTVRHWDANAGTAVRQMNHGAPVTSVAATPDGQRFASAGENGLAKLWNSADGREMANLTGSRQHEYQVAQVNRALELVKRHAANAKADLEEATKRKTAEEENAKKAEEAHKKAMEEHKAKTEAAIKPVADKEAADKALEELQPQVAKAEEAKKKNDEAAQQADEALKKVQAELETAAKAAADADAEAKKADEAKAAAEKALADAEAAAKKADEGDDQAAKDAAAKAVKEAKETKEAAEKAAKEAADAAKKAGDVKTAAEKAVADADGKKKAADEAKQTTDKAFTELEAKHKAADENAKKLADPAKKAVDERTAAERAFEAAVRSLERSKESVKKATEELPVAEADLKKQEEAQKAEETQLESLQKAAAERDAQLKELQTKKAAADKAAIDMAVAAKAAADALAAAEGVVAEATAAAKEVAEAGAKAVTEAEAVVKEATAKKDAAEKEAADAAADAKKATETAEAAAKALTEAEAAAKKADEGDDQAAKDAAAKALTEAKEKKEAADKAAAEAAEKAKKADEAKTAAEKELTDAQTKAKEATDQAAKADAEAEAKVKDATDKQTAAQNASKEAADKAKEAAAAKAAGDKELFALQQPMRAVAFSPDSLQLAAVSDDGNIYTFAAEEGALIDTFSENGFAPVAAAFGSEGALLAAAPNKPAILWDTAAQWQLVRTIGSPDSPDVLVDRVTALHFSPDSKVLATGGGEPSRSGELKLWNVADGKLVREIEDAHSDTVFGLEFSEDGKYLASGGADRFVKVFEAASGKFVKSFEGHTHHVLGVSWRADGRVLASCGADSVIKVWNFNTGEQQRTIQGFKKEVTAIQFVAVSDNMVVSAGDQQVSTKTVAGGNGPGYSGAQDFMYAVRNSLDGKTVVAGGQDSVLRVWDNTGKQIALFEAPKTPEQIQAEEEAAAAAEAETQAAR